MWGERAGRCGERIAGEFLVLRGLHVLDRNVRVGRGEIDLVARDGETIVFVEVKFRTGARFGGPLAAVSAKKRADVARAAAGYLGRRGLLGRGVRFDVVGITCAPDGLELRVTHVPNAYAGGGRQFY
ncbi:MAG TPA: YraN family protein [Candidatus Eisenbacteria bacterium]|jgi:putative endonuclease